VITHYLGIEHAHIALVVPSGGPYSVRGLLAVAGRPLGTRRNALRSRSWSIDGRLLATAWMLRMLERNPFTNAWLATKLIRLLACIGLGTVALAREPSPLLRGVRDTGALPCFASMYGVARTHHLLGLFASLAG
jgi:uncharacterized membrane protein SirB2